MLYFKGLGLLGYALGWDQFLMLNIVDKELIIDMVERIVAKVA
jgi:hypothetical protein